MEVQQNGQTTPIKSQIAPLMSPTNGKSDSNSGSSGKRKNDKPHIGSSPKRNRPNTKQQNGDAPVNQTKNTVALLNELRKNVVYEVESQNGPVHAPVFTMSVVVCTSFFSFYCSLICIVFFFRFLLFCFLFLLRFHS